MSHPLRHARRTLAAFATVALLCGHALADAKPKPRAESTQPATDAPQGVVNINTASAAELGRLPGIGPAKADAIIALRTRIKRFTRVEQLMRVRGIGRKTFRKLRPMLAIKGPTTLGTPGAPRTTAGRGKQGKR